LINGNQAPSVCFATSTNTTPAWKVGLSGNNSANFAISSGAAATDAVTIDSSGDLGLGVVPSATGSNARALQLTNYGTLSGNGNLGFMSMAANAYESADNSWNRVNATTAARYQISYTGEHSWYNAGSGIAGSAISFTQAMTLDANGNLGVGTSTPSLYSGYKSITLAGGATGGVVDISGSGGITSGGCQFSARATDTTIDAFGPSGGSAAFLAFRTGTSGSVTERARITSGGVFCVNLSGVTYSTEKFAVLAGNNQEAAAFKTNAGATTFTVAVCNTATSGDNKFVVFATESTDTTRGSITYNRAGGLVAYNVTSDYRAKDILGPVQNSGATIDALKVYEGQMKGATQSRPMLVAHEAQEHAPYTVTGEKDAVNEDGTPNYQQMDVSALVPLLLAEVQSLRKRVAELESK